VSQDQLTHRAAPELTQPLVHRFGPHLLLSAGMSSGLEDEDKDRKMAISPLSRRYPNARRYTHSQSRSQW
jgi:hypothetical protein